MILESIPHFEDPKQTIEIGYINSHFVKVEERDGIFLEMKYPKMGMQYAEKDCLLRKDVYENLLLAQEKLPEGYHLKIWDAWRPFLLQRELYETYYSQIVKTFGIENLSEEEKVAVVRKYVSVPVKSTYEYPVHTSGGAIDVTLVDDGGKELDMGTTFDEMVPAAQTNFFENKGYERIKANRRILYNTMISAGFTNLPSEWWHYDFGDRYWAFYKGKPVIYEAVYTKEEVQFEKKE